MADDNGVPFPHRTDEPDNVGGHRIGVVSARRFVAGPVTTQIDPPRPGIRRRREPGSGSATSTRTPGTVQQNDERARSRFGDVESDSVGINKPMTPRALGQHHAVVNAVASLACVQARGWAVTHIGSTAIP